MDLREQANDSDENSALIGFEFELCQVKTLSSNFYLKTALLCSPPLRKTERDAVTFGDSIVWHVRATLAKVKVHTHCFPGARVLDVSAQIPAILKDDESVAAVVIHAGVNDIKLRQTETLKRDFRSLIEMVRSTSPATTIIMSGPLPTY